MTGPLVLAVAVAAALGLALFLRWKDGRFSRRPVEDAGERLGPAELGVALGDRATLVQFSSSFCAPCRATRTVLGQVVELVPGVTTVEIDAESELELVRRLDVLRTPTVVVLDASGRVVSRASGAPTKDQVLVALDAAISG